MTKKNIAIGLFLLILVAGGSFYGGMVYEKNSLENQRFRHDGLGNRSGIGMARPQGMGPGRNNNGDFVTGEVISRDEKSITIKTMDGGSKIIYFSDSTIIGKSTEGISEDLEIGKQVMVNGKISPEGTFAAESIQIRPGRK